MFRHAGSKLLPPVLMALLVVLALPAAGAASVPSVSELFRTVPAPPDSTAVAALWVQDGRVTAPEILQLDATLKTARASALSDADAIATAADATSAGDAPAAKAAAEGYRAYLAQNAGGNAPAAALGARVQWLAKRFSGLRKRVEKTDDVQHVRDQELAAYRALFTDWQAQRAPIVAKAQAELTAAGDPSAIRSGADRAAVLRYRAAMIEETEVLLGLTRYAVERAAGLPTAEPASITPSANTLWDLMSDRRKP